MAKTKKEQNKYPTKHCKNCGLKFKPNRKWHEFCSTKCRVEYWYKEKTKANELKAVKERIEKIEKQLGIQ